MPFFENLEKYKKCENYFETIASTTFSKSGFYVNVSEALHSVKYLFFVGYFWNK